MTLTTPITTSSIKLGMIIMVTSQLHTSGADSPSLPPELRKDLKQQLRFNLNGIKRKYTFFVECVCMSIKTRGISAMEMSTFLLSQSVYDYDDQDYKLFSERKDELERAVEVDQIFNILNTGYASFFNYDIFISLVEKYNLNEGQEELKYPEHLQNYINKQNVTEFLDVNPALVNQTDASKKMTLKLDIKPTCKLAKMKELSDAIADRMEWSPSALRILDIGEGCIVMTLLAPASLADATFNGDNILTAAQREGFLQLNVLWLNCNEYTYHFTYTKNLDHVRVIRRNDKNLDHVRVIRRNDVM